MMLLPLLALFAVDVAAYGVMQARTTCKPLEASDSMTYHYSQGTVSGQYGKQEYENGVKVTVSCKQNSQEILGTSEATCKNGRWTPEPGSCSPKRCLEADLLAQQVYTRISGGERHSAGKVPHGETVTAHHNGGTDTVVCCLGFWLKGDSCPSNINTSYLH